LLGNINIGDIILWFVVFLFSLSFHEAAHAWTADRFGDYTGRYLGRITLNPIVHIDPIGTILFPLLGFLSGVPMFGWAKPVPVNPLLWQEKNKANILTLAAGPISNFILVIIALLTAKALLISGILMPNYFASTMYEILAPAYSGSIVMEPLSKIICITIFLNLSLAIFNLIPIPPLDGSHILESLLPYEMARAYEQIRPYGFLLLIGLMYLGVFWAVYSPFYYLVAGFLRT